MEILLDPNVAYLLLVAFFWLAMIALLTPGTGVVEVATVFAMILAGWSALNLPVNFWALAVLALGVLPFWLALRKSGNMLFLGISILALVVGSSFLFRGQGWLPAVNPFLALAVSTLTAGFFWIAARKTLEAEHARPVHDLEGLIGSTGEAKTDILSSGTVQVEGELWSAASREMIPAGATVRVVGREGFILTVEPAEGREGLTPDPTYPNPSLKAAEEQP